VIEPEGPRRFMASTESRDAVALQSLLSRNLTASGSDFGSADR